MYVKKINLLKRNLYYILFYNSFIFFLGIIYTYFFYSFLNTESLYIYLTLSTLLIILISVLMKLSIDGFLFKLSSNISNKLSKLSLKDAINYVIEESKNLIDWDCINFGIIKDEKLHILYTTTRGFDFDFYTPLGRGIAWKSIMTKKATLVKDTLKDKEYVRVNPEVNCELCIPLFYEDNPLGVLDFEHKKTNAFDENDLIFGNLFTHELSRIIHTHLKLLPLLKTSRNIRNGIDDTGKVINEFTSKVNENVESASIIHAETGKMIDTFNSFGNSIITIKGTNEKFLKETEKLLNMIGEITNEVEKKSKEIKEHGNILSDTSEFLKIITGSIKEIEESTKDFRNIIDSIVEFSDDTSLLAINASIEAARVGEVGRGFSVIAQEISTLSSNTILLIEKAKDILDNYSSKLNNIVQNVESKKESINLYRKFTESLENYLSFVSARLFEIKDIIGKNSMMIENLKKNTDIIEQEIGRSINLNKEKGEKITNLIYQIKSSLSMANEFEAFMKKILGEIENLNAVIEEFSLNIKDFFV